MTSKKLIIKSYLKLLKSLKREPEFLDLEKEGITRSMVRVSFGTISNLKKQMRNEYPDKHVGFIDKNIQAEIPKTNKYIITTAIAGDKASIPLLKSIANYCKVNKAQHLVLVSYPHQNKNNTQSYNLDQNIIDFGGKPVVQNLKLNTNVIINMLAVSAKQINPLIGLKRIGQQCGSSIYASPKQCLEPVATSNIKLPKVMLTTGACTLPNYGIRKKLKNRTDYIADVDHIMGGLIVEIKDSHHYFFRHFQADKLGNFIDLGRQYTPDSVSKVAPEVLVWGDYHAGSVDTPTKLGNINLMNFVDCKTAILHDLFDGLSVNPHNFDKNILLASYKLHNPITSLDQEFKLIAKELTQLLNSGIEKVVIVESNHHDFLRRWLEDGRYSKDPTNLGVGVKLANAYLSGKNPIQYGVEKIGNLNEQLAKKIKWLIRDEDYKISGIECGAHGDKGANGSKANVINLENAYGHSVTAHTHSPKIQRGVYIVGTSTKLKLGYNEGPSGWMHASCLVYPNGSRQMIVFINGKYTI